MKKSVNLKPLQVAAASAPVAVDPMEFSANELVESRNSVYNDAWLATGNTLASLHDGGGLDKILATPYGYAYVIIQNKLDRILADPSNADSWKDIAGYATLVVNDMQK